jgi:hypothetical protein
VPFMKDLDWLKPGLFDEMVDELVQFKGRCDKPFIAIVVPGHVESQALEWKGKLVAHDIPTFPRFERGANALMKAIEYWGSQTD